MICDDQGSRKVDDDGIKSASKGQGRRGDTALNAKQASGCHGGGGGEEEAKPSVTRAKTRPNPCGEATFTLTGFRSGNELAKSTLAPHTRDQVYRMYRIIACPPSQPTAYVRIAHAQRSTDCYSTEGRWSHSRLARSQEAEKPRRKKQIQDSFRLTARAGG
jgi:hypothetical protein